MNHYKILLYYKYQNLENPQKLVEEHIKFCKGHPILGRIIIADEGINGTCAGEEENINAYMDYIHSVKGLEDVWFKQQICDFIPFKRLSIRYKKEIVALGIKADINKKGQYITPAELNKLYKNNEDFVIFDARNEIESKVGHFKNSIMPKIKHFREFPKIIQRYSHLKNKKIILYCTGGIRCEKASTLLIQNGFKNVYQLEGGIYNYFTKFPSGIFIGNCFVFDERMNISFENDGIKYNSHISDDKIISKCTFCKIKSARIVNDERIGRHLVVCCGECDEKFGVSLVKNRKYYIKSYTTKNRE